MAAPDLSNARAKALELLVDTCTVEHDADGYRDDTFDPATGTWLRAVGEGTADNTYACLLSRAGRADSDYREGGEQDKMMRRMILKLPPDATCPPGAVVTMTAARDNAWSVGRSFRVQSSKVGTYSVLMRCDIEEIEATVVEHADQ